MSHLFAYLSRMKLITRWPLMHNIRTENVQEHSLQVAMIAHALAVIGNTFYQQAHHPEKIATMAMFHDASEVFTGDMPTPIKYFNANITHEYKKIEQVAEQKLLAMVPPELNEAYQKIIDSNTMDETEKKILKAADTIAAYLKCVEEIRFGNHEFQPAYKRLETLLNNHALAEVQYFLKVFIPSFHLSFDEISVD